MPSTQNTQQLDQLKAKVEKAKSVVITDYAGLTVSQQTKLRSELKAAGGEFIVGKNTLLRLALKKNELNDTLQGQSGVLFAYEDEISPMKALVNFIKEVEKPILKAGMLAGKLLSVKDIQEYAKLPGKDEMISMLIQRIQGTTYGLVSVLQGGMRNLVYALLALEKKKASEQA